MPIIINNGIIDQLIVEILDREIERNRWKLFVNECELRILEGKICKLEEELKIPLHEKVTKKIMEEGWN